MMMKSKHLKKLGYGVAVHYNEYKKKFEIYQIGTYAPGATPTKNSKLILSNSLKKGVKEYVKTFLK